MENIRERKASRAARRKQLAKRRTAASQQRMRIINQLARNNKVTKKIVILEQSHSNKANRLDIDSTVDALDWSC